MKILAQFYSAEGTLLEREVLAAFSLEESLFVPRALQKMAFHGELNALPGDVWQLTKKSRAALFEGLERTAQISPCKLYRYELRRIWEPGRGLVNFIGLNPSTADAWCDDPTIRRCVRFALDWGYGGIVMTNLFAYRLTDSKKLKTVRDAVGEGNGAALTQATSDSQLIVCAWGRHALAAPVARTLTATLAQRELHCLGLTKNGFPRHPLYIRADAELISYVA